jgi:hypothetical protein
VKPGGRHIVNEHDLMEEIERAEETHRALVETTRSLGTWFAETLHNSWDIREFRRLLEDLPHLTRSADLKRTQLKHEYLSRRLKEVEKELRRASGEAKRAADVFKKAQKAHAEASHLERRLNLEARRLREFRDEEAGRLARLRAEDQEAASHGDGAERRKLEATGSQTASA